MSLIFGIFAKDRDLDESLWRPCLDELTHEGRRTLEIRVGPRLVVASVHSRRELDAPRIAESPDGGSQLLFAGEIFDYETELPELERHLDREVDPREQAALVLWGFERHGTEFLRRLSGAFAIAHHDAARQVLSLANDPFGMHPIFVWEDQRLCVFGSELEPMVRVPSFRPELDVRAVSEYFTVARPYEGRTFFTGVSNLPPGTLLRIGEATHATRYDDLAVSIDRSLTLDEAADTTFAVLRQAARARLRYRDTARAALTGGLDSRLLLGLLTPEQRDRVEFRTIRETWLAEDEDTDYQIAKTLARRFGLRLVTRESEGPGRAGVVDRSFLARLRTLKGKAYKFEGFYGDNFLSSKVEHPLIQEMLYERPPNEVRQQMEAFMEPGLAASLPNPLESLRAVHSRIAAEQRDYLYYIRRMTRAWFTSLGGGSPKGWVSPLRHIAHGLDSIFRDTEVLRHLLTVPVEYHRERRLYERIYQRCLPELCTIPTTRRGSSIPHARRPRPLSQAEPDYGPILGEYLGSADTWSKGLYHEPQVRRAVADAGHWLVPPLVDFESWYRERFLPIAG